MNLCVGKRRLNRNIQSIVKHIVMYYDGLIELDSIEGKGMKIVVYSLLKNKNIM